jgi:hypothetical protein
MTKRNIRIEIKYDFNLKLNILVSQSRTLEPHMLTQQLSDYYLARAHSFIDLPSTLDIILVHFIPE